MAVARVGEVWSIKGADHLALVIFVRPENGPHSEDVRVVPVYQGPQFIAFATHRDVIVPAPLNSFGEPLLAATWNARGLTRSDLGHLAGRVEPAAVEAARLVEMSCIIPNLDLSSARGLQGKRPASDVGLARAVEFQRRELIAWDKAIDALKERVSEMGQILAKSTYVPKAFGSGYIVSVEPQWSYGETIITIQLPNGEIVCQGPGIPDPGVLGIGDSKLPHHGAVLAFGLWGVPDRETHPSCLC